MLWWYSQSWIYQTQIYLIIVYIKQLWNPLGNPAQNYSNAPCLHWTPIHCHIPCPTTPHHFMPGKQCRWPKFGPVGPVSKNAAAGTAQYWDPLAQHQGHSLTFLLPSTTECSAHNKDVLASGHSDMHISHLDIVGHNSDTVNKSIVGLVCTGKEFSQPLWQSTHRKVLDTQWLLQAARISFFAYGSLSPGWRVGKKKNMLQLVKTYAYVEKCKKQTYMAHTWNAHLSFFWHFSSHREIPQRNMKQCRPSPELLTSTLPKA